MERETCQTPAQKPRVKWEHTGVKGPLKPPTESSKIDHIHSTWLPNTWKMFISWFPTVRTTL